MAYTEDEHPSTTVIEERDGMSGALMTIVTIVLVLFLVWVVFFSGWVMNRDSDTQDTSNIEQREGDTNVEVPPADENQPAPQQSPGGY